MGNGSENEGLTYSMLGEQIELSDKGNGKEEHGGCGVCVCVLVCVCGMGERKLMSVEDEPQQGVSTRQQQNKPPWDANLHE